MRHRRNKHYITPGLEYTPDPEPVREGILAQIEVDGLKYQYNQLDEQMVEEHLAKMEKVVLYTGIEGMKDFNEAIKDYIL